MAGTMSGTTIFVAILSCLALLQQLSYAQTVYKVGGSTGWAIPSSNSLYSTWATKQTFNVGDILEFDFTTGQHTVAEVSKSSYDSCNLASPISTQTNGPANMTIKTAGAHYYICTIGTHCKGGQKLAVSTSSSASAPTTSKSPASAPSATTTPGTAADSPTGSTTPGSGSGSGSGAAGSPTSSASINVAATGFVLVSLAALAF